MRPSSLEKANYINLITRDFVEGLSASEIAEKHGISTASVYRWWRQRDEIEHDINAEATSRQISINIVLEVLCQPRNHSEANRREAVFQFLSWVRWPAEPGFYLAALINCIASYLKQSYETVDISALPSEERLVLFKYLTLDVAARFASPHAAVNPDFEIVTDQASRYDDRQFFAQVINYLLSEQETTRQGVHRPTLNSLQALAETDAFGSGWAMSRRTFEKYWRRRAPSFPFLYVEQYHSRFDWSPNPLDADFAQSIDEIMEDIDAIPVYLGRVKWVIRELTRVLDARAVARIRFPFIPDFVEAVPTKNPPLNKRLQAKIAEFF